MKLKFHSSQNVKSRLQIQRNTKKVITVNKKSYGAKGNYHIVKLRELWQNDIELEHMI